MTAAEKIIATLRAEVGYIEKRSNSQLDDPAANAGSGNYTKYARDLDGTDIFNGPKQGYDWCAVFTVWPYWKLWGAEVARCALYLPRRSCAAGVDWMVRYFREAGAFVMSPVIGGPIFFKNSKGEWQHVETVVDYRGGTVYTVGGNTSGGRVAAKQYSVKDTSIGGYGRPNWAAAPVKAETEEEDNMPRYNTLDEIKAGAPYAHATAEKLVKLGILQGSGKKDAKGYPADLDLSLDMLRLLVIADRAGAFDGR